VPNALIDDPDLPADAKGVMVWIYSRPEKQADGAPWVFRRSAVATAMRLGEKTTKRIFRELIETGWLARHGQVRAGGQWGEARYVPRRVYLQEYVHPAYENDPTVGQKEAHGANPHGTGTSENGNAENADFAAFPPWGPNGGAVRGPLNNISEDRATPGPQHPRIESGLGEGRNPPSTHRMRTLPSFTQAKQASRLREKEPEFVLDATLRATGGAPSAIDDAPATAADAPRRATLRATGGAPSAIGDAPATAADAPRRPPRTGHCTIEQRPLAGSQLAYGPPPSREVRQNNGSSGSAGRAADEEVLPATAPNRQPWPGSGFAPGNLSVSPNRHVPPDHRPALGPPGDSLDDLKW